MPSSRVIAVGDISPNSRVANAADFGALADGLTAIDPAIAAVISAGVKTLVFDEGSSFYRLASTVAMPSGFSIVAGKGRPTIKMDSAAVSRMFTFNGVSDAHIKGLKIDGNSSVTPSDAMIVMNGGSTFCSIEQNIIQNAPSLSTTGSIIISGSSTSFNLVSGNFISGTESTAIGLSGCSENEVSFNRLQNNGGFGIRLGEAANKNLIEGNRSTSSTIEVIATTWDCYENRIIGNHCEGSGDNGISVSGYRNVVSGNICCRNQKAGIGIWGSQNAVVGNNCFNNNLANTNFWSGVWVSANYGGTGQNNTISGNNLDDDQATPTQYNCVRVDASGYTAWAAGQTISPGDYRVSGLNIYQAASGGTAASSGPTHTSGTVADGGGVQWKYLSSFRIAATVRNNTVIGNVPGLTKSGVAFDDPGSWGSNTLIAHGTINVAINPTYGLHFQTLPSYANDSAAAAAGLGIGQVYLNGNVMQIRII